jgi:hypothetical protein
MIEGVAEPDEARPDRAQVGGFQRERFEELLDLPDRFVPFPFLFSSFALLGSLSAPSSGRA